MASPNRVHFRCPFHGETVEATLTLDDDGHFVCVFRPSNKTVWPVQGRWSRNGDVLCLTTPHGYATVILRVRADQTLVGLDQRGGFADFNIKGARSTVLQRPLPERPSA